MVNTYLTFVVANLLLDLIVPLDYQHQDAQHCGLPGPARQSSDSCKPDQTDRKPGCEKEQCRCKLRLRHNANTVALALEVSPYQPWTMARPGDSNKRRIPPDTLKATTKRLHALLTAKHHQHSGERKLRCNNVRVVKSLDYVLSMHNWP